MENLPVLSSAVLLDYRGDASNDQPVFPSPSRRDRGKPLTLFYVSGERKML
ncbi:hypothetical protein LC653_40880 [Nostoc sp. CHAB 5784]|uniref:hypothetical protein n=1 Tax=Nostoc mirabile TaxID=2907820 RepID=UPI001E3AC348|nr:hypothetical protein [Nostoc mirabile]MCC5669992.1 hypothetical protein [Nostoc mirabile CHAB5784]